MNIYVGNLPYTASEDDLRDAFSEFGQVESANIIMDKFSGRSKGFGFVCKCLMTMLPAKPLKPCTTKI